MGARQAARATGFPLPPACGDRFVCFFLPRQLRLTSLASSDSIKEVAAADG